MMTVMKNVFKKFSICIMLVLSFCSFSCKPTRKSSMTLEIWGSGGGEGYPGVFCNCENCNLAREQGGKNIRSLSQALVNQDLIIDLPADTNMHLSARDLSLGNFENLLITHVHSDHYAPSIFSLRGGTYAHNMQFPQMNVYGSNTVREYFDKEFSVFPIDESIKENILFPTVAPYTEIQVGKYSVIALPANHAPELNCFNYLISDGKTALLYLIDTGYPFPEVISFLEAYPVKIGCVAMDATMGNAPLGIYAYHMGFAENIQLKKELTEKRIATERTLFVAMHITHNHTGLHKDTRKYLSEENIILAYDGITLYF